MAEPVIVPVQLEVHDINMNFDAAEINKELRETLSGVRKTLNDIFSQADPSTLNKAITKSMRGIERDLSKAEVAQRQYNRALVAAGKSTAEYKAEVKELELARAKLSEISDQKEIFEEGFKSGSIVQDKTNLEAYQRVVADYYAQLRNVQQLENATSDPANYAVNSGEEELNRIYSAYLKVIDAVRQLNITQADYNKVAQENKLTDEYTEMVKQAEVYKKKLEELDAKARRMEALGATDKQWEALRYDTELISSEMDNLIKKMRDAVKTGKAFRLGDGDKDAARKDINQFAKFNRTTSGNIVGRAQNNESPYTKDYQSALNDLDKLEQKVNQLNEKYREMQALGKLTPDGLAKMKYDAEQLQGKLDASKAKLTEMVNNGTAFKLGTGNTEAELNGINTRLTESRTKLNEINGATATMPANLSNVAGVVQSLSRTVNRLAVGFIKAVTGCALLGKQGKSTGLQLGKIFNKLKRSVLMYGFGFRSAYVAIRRIRTLVVKEFKLLAQSHSDINSQVTSLTMAFNTLKGSVATAFQPLASVVIPILKTAMNALTGFLESIGKFIATLTGQSYIYKAVAKNIDSVADSAKEANKQLGSYDKLEVINKDNGSGNDLSDELGIDYEKVGIEGGSNFAKLIKEAWEKQDFTEVGLTIGNKLVEALNGVQWGPIREKAKGIATSIATLLNGFFATPDLGQSIGKSIANALGAAIDFAHTALSTLNFEQIGQVAGNAINSFVEKMSDENSWAKAGQSVSKAIRGIIEAIKTALATTNWFEVGQGIGTYISNIEWGKVLWDFATLVGAVLKAIGEALAGWAKEDPLSAILVTLIVAIAGALTAAAKLFTLLKTFVEIKKVLDATGLLKGAGGAGGGTAKSIEGAATNTESVNTATSNLTTKLTTLVKNLALGLVIILEVVAAAVLIVGAIWLLGVMLEQVGIAWEPVIENAETVGVAMLIGTLLLAGIGVAAALLGKLGGTMCAQIAIGIAILALIGAAAVLFIAEIIVIGLLLQQVGKAWQPVLDNGENIATAVAIGAALLIGIGVVTALLGLLGTALLAPLALGTAILVLLGVAAVLFIAEIIIIGVLLEQVGKAWQPVLDNGETIATAIAVGTGLLIGIGVVAALLGVAAVASAGLLPLAIGLGTAMLVELGVAAVLFIAEIWAIGKGLDKIGKAWQPVLDNGATIEEGIKTGTELLIDIGVVTAALGVASVASVGLLPLAVGLGTALLVQLSEAFVSFVESLVKVADQLRLELHPALDNLNVILPPLSDNMEDFTEFMKSFATKVVEFTGSNIIAGIGATIDKIVGIFTADPIQHLYDEVTSQTKEFNNLVPALETIVPLIDKATKLVGEYKSKMGSFESSVGGSGGFLGSLVKGAKNVVNGLIGMFEGMVNGVIKAVNAMIKALNKLSFDVPDWVPSIGGKKFGFNIKTLNTVSIPRLAQGAVIPPNKEFLAMLGDQKHGTNIEAPLDTIKQALAEVLAESGGGRKEPIILQVNGRTLAQVVWDEQTKRYKQTGKYSPA